MVVKEVQIDPEGEKRLRELLMSSENTITAEEALKKARERRPEKKPAKDNK